MADGELRYLLIHDAWDALRETLRKEFLTRRMDSTGWGPYPRQESDGRRWEPLRPMVIEERAYRGLESIAARLLHLAVDACRRRASNLGELHRALRFPHELPLMDSDRPLVAAELTRYARPDILIERGRPRFLEFNNSTRLAGGTLTPWLAETYARLCPQSGLRAPPSTVTARSTALARPLRPEIGHADPRRLLIPSWRGIDGTSMARHYETVTRVIQADAQRVGLEVVHADLADLRLDAGRLLAADVPIDVVLLHWGGDGVVDDGDGHAALRSADRARTVELFPRTESDLISSKVVLSWLHEDCDADLLAPADRALVCAYVPWTACLGLDGDPSAHEKLLRMATGERARLVLKPAVGISGDGVLFGSRTSKQNWASAVLDAARESPVVLQQHVESDRIMMPFHDRDTGQQVIANVPFVLSPFIIDGAAASIKVRHMGPGAPVRDVVIGAVRRACQSTALLAPEPAAQGPRGWFSEGE